MNTIPMPNKAAAPNAAMTSLLQTARYWRGVGEPRRCMKLPPLIFMTLFVWCAAAQQLQTNILTTEQAIKVASQLGVHMREKDVTAFVERKGLKCGLVRLGGSFDWSNFCELSNKCCLELHFRQNRLWPDKWEYGLLDSAFIQSNGARIVSISLTNSVKISNAP